MTMLKPFWSYLGGKWQKAPRYPKPEHDTIIEPFAGAAGYSTRYADRQVILIEKDPRIAALWHYLISVTASEIRALPLVKPGQSVDELNLIPEARDLIGFWLGKGFESPRKRISESRAAAYPQSSWWGIEIRARIAGQVGRIKHWKLIEGDFGSAPDMEATWFVDPPYQLAGIMYKESASAIDFKGLAQWCKQRRGLTIVCENDGADWLPFEPLYELRGQSNKHSVESVWINRTLSPAPPVPPAE